MISLTLMEVPFSLASPSQTVMAGGLGAANLAGVLWLGRLLKSSNWPLITASNPVLALTLQNLFPALISYALTYAVIPIFRSAKNKKNNILISERNARRLAWQEELKKPGTHLSAKIMAARKVADIKGINGKRMIDNKEIDYSTKDDEQVEDFKRFDRKLDGK